MQLIEIYDGLRLTNSIEAYSYPFHGNLEELQQIISYQAVRYSILMHFLT